MKKILILCLLLVVFISPIKVSALSNYEDPISKITNVKVDENKIDFYLFYGKECPHCEEERQWLKSIKKKYSKNINFYEYEVWHNKENNTLMENIKTYFNVTEKGVPFTVIGDKSYVGYSGSLSSVIENKIKNYLDVSEDENEVKIPIIGTVNMKSVSIPLVAVILGFIDGFNPCAMWILLFLISMLFNMNDKKKSWILGITFLFISGLVYFLSMLGINFIIGIATINYLKILIALFILIAGILNLKKYLKVRKEDSGCTVIDNKKRKKIITRIKKILNSNSFILSLIGIIFLAVSVNLIELACSLGFPVIFTEILSLNNITGITKILYLLLYILFYMIDDIVVFSISMITLEATGITNKYSKLCTLVSAIIMIIMGVLLLFKPDWLMLNF